MTVILIHGHTALAVYGSIVLGQWLGPAWAIVSVPIALFEMTTVIVLSTHSKMHVFAGAVAAFSAVVAAAAWIAPTCDHWLVQLAADWSELGKRVSPNSQQR